MACLANSRRIRDWCREHLAILEAIAKGDFNQASTAMRLHLEQALACARAPGT
jgi:DNA-binding GntR family transcriptional regulator